MNYAQIFGPVTTEVTALFITILPMCLGIFALIIGIRLGAKLLTEFVGGHADEDEDED